MLTRAQSGLCKRVPGLYGFALIFICLCSTYADQVKSLSKHMVGTKTRPSQKCQHCITLPACNDSTQAPFISLRRWVISSWWRVQINTWKKVERNENKKKRTLRGIRILCCFLTVCIWALPERKHISAGKTAGEQSEFPTTWCCLTFDPHPQSVSRD